MLKLVFSLSFLFMTELALAGAKPGVAPYPADKEKVATIIAAPINRTNYKAGSLEPIFKDAPLSVLVFDTNTGRFVVHMPRERNDRLGEIWAGRKMKLTCEPIVVRTFADGNQQTHCILKEIIECGCSGK